MLIFIVVDTVVDGTDWEVIVIPSGAITRYIYISALAELDKSPLVTCLLASLTQSKLTKIKQVTAYIYIHMQKRS